MLKLATLIHNAGEPELDSRFADPQALADLGYNGWLLYETTALSGLIRLESVQDPEIRRWIEQTTASVSTGVEQARQAGMDVYLAYDMLVLGQHLVDRDGEGLTCKGRPGVLCPASERTLQRCVEGLGAMLDRWPDVAGVVLRFGDCDARRFPFLVGNDVYTPHCPRCNHIGRAERIADLIRRAYEQVVEKHGKRLIARAWNVRPNGIHDTPELTKRIVEQLPGEEGDDRLVLSFKVSQTDFWRYQPWNRASLACGNRPVMYELQCQREFEGKGGIPNWQVGLWRDGDPSVREASEPSGLAEAASAVNFAGVMAWVRGGGWGGPFVNDESWIDANVYAAPRLADDPSMSAETLADEWIRDRLKIDDEKPADAVRQVLLRSAELVRMSFYVEAFARSRPDAWHPAADWVSDDLLDVEAAWRMVQRLPADQLDQVVGEKCRAADLVSKLRHDVQRALGDRPGTQEALLNTLVYTESFVEALRDLVAGLVAYRRFKKDGRSIDGQDARNFLLRAQSHWNHHTQRHGNLRGAATPFREIGLWELTQNMLADIGATA